MVLRSTLERNADLFPEPAQRRILAPSVIKGGLNELFACAGERGIPLYVSSTSTTTSRTILVHEGAAARTISSTPTCASTTTRTASGFPGRFTLGSCPPVVVLSHRFLRRRLLGAASRPATRGQRHGRLLTRASPPPAPCRSRAIVLPDGGAPDDGAPGRRTPLYSGSANRTPRLGGGDGASGSIRRMSRWSSSPVMVGVKSRHRRIGGSFPSRRRTRMPPNAFSSV